MIDSAAEIIRSGYEGDLARKHQRDLQLLQYQHHRRGAGPQLILVAAVGDLLFARSGEAHEALAASRDGVTLVRSR